MSISGTVLSLLVVGVLVSQTPAADQHEPQRLRMVEDYIRAEGVENPRVLEAMRSVPRHEFVPQRMRDRAYQDQALSIGGRQTISPPFIVAWMTETIDPQSTDRVLEIGTGSGYQAAVLSGLVAEVYTIEIVASLGKTAARRLSRLGYDNVHTRIGDGYKGWDENAPFDGIIVTCSPESVPEPLVEQLREGGRMLIPLGERYQQVFYLFEKSGGQLEQKRLVPTLFVPMTGISEAQRKVRPDPLRPALVNGSFEDDDNSDQRADNWHYQRQTTLSDDDSLHGKRCLLLENKEPGRLAQILQGTAIDGRRIAAVRLQLWVRHAEIEPGLEAYQQASAMLHFYDAGRRTIGTDVIGPWRGSLDWHRTSREITVPKAAREMIVRVGLNGATGQLWIDNVDLTVRPR